MDCFFRSRPASLGAVRRFVVLTSHHACAVGNSLIKVVADDETGELEAATILGQFGEIPDDFAEGLQNA